MKLLLASKSPRRKELLELITSDFLVTEAAIDEKSCPESRPEKIAEFLARQKAAAVAERNPGCWVIGSDTVVDLEGQPLGKPEDPAQARAMLEQMSGKKHRVHTGVCLACATEKEMRLDCFVDTVEVYFDQIPKEELEAYILTQEPYDKAGGYGIQGWAARYIYRIEGCYQSVMGLPVARLYSSLRRCGAL